MVGKGGDKSSVIRISDAKGKDRLTIYGIGDSIPKNDFYDENGKVVYSLPEE